MNDAIIGAIGGLITGLVGAYIALRMVKPNVRVLNSQEQLNLSTALKNAVDALTDSLETSSNVRQQAEQERQALEKRIDELEAHREARTKQIEDQNIKVEALEQSLEKSNREYTKAISTLQQQVGDWEKRYTELEAKYANSKHAIEILVNALRDANIPLPPGLELFLGDSMTKFKLKR